jgi:hypothetical protein
VGVLGSGNSERPLMKQQFGNINPKSRSSWFYLLFLFLYPFSVASLGTYGAILIMWNSPLNSPITEVAVALFVFMHFILVQRKTNLFLLILVTAAILIFCNFFDSGRWLDAGIITAIGFAFTSILCRVIGYSNLWSGKRAFGFAFIFMVGSAVLLHIEYRHDPMFMFITFFLVFPIALIQVIQTRNLGILSQRLVAAPLMLVFVPLALAVIWYSLGIIVAYASRGSNENNIEAA